MNDDIKAVNKLQPDSLGENVTSKAESTAAESSPPALPQDAQTPPPQYGQQQPPQYGAPQQQQYGVPPPQYYGQPQGPQPYYPPMPPPYPYAPQGYYPPAPRKKKKSHTMGAVAFTLTMIGAAIFLLAIIIYWPVVLMVISALKEGDAGGLILGILFGAPLAIILELITYLVAGLYMLLSLAVIILFIVGMVRKAAKKHLLIAGFIINLVFTAAAVLQVILMFGHGFLSSGISY